MAKSVNEIYNGACESWQRLKMAKMQRRRRRKMKWRLAGERRNGEKVIIIIVSEMKIETREACWRKSAAAESENENIENSAASWRKMKCGIEEI